MNGRTSHSEMLNTPPLAIPNASMARAMQNRTITPTPSGEARNCTCRSATPRASQITRAMTISSSTGVMMPPEMPYTSWKLRNSGTLAVSASGLGSEKRSIMVPITTSITTGAGRTRQNSTGTKSAPTNTIATAWSLIESIPPIGPSTSARRRSRPHATASWRRRGGSGAETARSRRLTTSSVPEAEQEDERQRQARHDQDRDVRGAAVRPVVEAQEHRHPDHDGNPFHELVQLTGWSGGAA